MEAQKQFSDLQEAFCRKYPDVSRRTVFGKPALAVDGKAFAGLSGEFAIFKLPEERRDEVEKWPGVEHWAPPFGNHGKRKEWLQVPLAFAKDWDELAEVARTYAGNSV